MNISNLMGQYSQGASAGAEKLAGKKGVENLASSIKSLTKGNVFEGTVSSMKNGKVTLALSNGTLISARLDGKVSLTVGQSMFFQVKSNEGNQIAIRPFIADGARANITLMQALSAAGLPAEEHYLAMVNKMMEEQMPIDRASVQQMARLVNTNSGIDIGTVVQMQKLGIPITMENAIQFEHYLGDKQAITDAFDELIQMLPGAMQGEELSEGELRQMNAQVLSIVTEGLVASEGAPGENLLILTAEQTLAEAEQAQLAAEGELLPENEVDANTVPEGANQEAGYAEDIETAGSLGTDGKSVAQVDVGSQTAALDAVNAGQESIKEGAPTSEAQSAADAAQEKQGAKMQELSITLEAGETPEHEHTLGAVLDRKQLTELTEQLGRLVGQERVSYDPKQEVPTFLNDLQQLLRSELPVDRGGLQRLLASEPFKSLIRDALQQQWTIRPDELTDSDQINKLYEKQNSQMNRMADVLKVTGQDSASFARMASDIRGNVDFMNQINQLYSYVQIPLKMSGGNASGELFVYTNKKALAEGSKDLSAFLHLDMENLGATDVSVRLHGREVSTNFYLENDEAYRLLEQHLPILEERLRSKGYNCKISVTNENRHVNFVEDFLKKDQPSAGQLHRYSFDMRA